MTHKSMTIEELWEFLPEEYNFAVRNPSGNVLVSKHRPNRIDGGWAFPRTSYLCIYPFDVELPCPWEESLIERPARALNFVGCLCRFQATPDAPPVLDTLTGEDEYGFISENREQRFGICDPVPEEQIQKWLDAIRRAG